MSSPTTSHNMHDVIDASPLAEIGVDPAGAVDRFPSRAATTASAQRSWSAVIVGAPGDGTLLLVDWLLIACAARGNAARAVPIGGGSDRPHGMYVEVAPAPDQLEAMPGMPDASVDLVIAGEHLELLRVLAAGWIDAARTTVIASCRRAFTPVERAVAVQHVVREREIDTLLQAAALRYIAFDGPQVAGWYSLPARVQPGLLMGALVGSQATAIDMPSAQTAIARLGIDVALHIQGLRRGRPLGRRTGGRVQRTLTAQQFVRKRRGALPRSERAGFEQLIDRIERSFPTHLHAQLRESVVRLVDYQDCAHAAGYLDRCAHVVEAGEASGDDLTTFVRNLAHIMIYPDPAHAAHVKLHRGRLARIRREHGVQRFQEYSLEDVIPIEVDEASPTLLDRLLRRVPASPSHVLAGMPQLVCANPTTLRGIRTLRRVRAARERRTTTARFAHEMDHADAYTACMREVFTSAPQLAAIVAESGSMVQGSGAVRLATGAAAQAFWGRIVRQSLVVDRRDPTGTARYASCVVPHVWTRVCESGPLALWEYCGGVVGIAMQHSRGASFDQVLAWAHDLCGISAEPADAED